MQRSMTRDPLGLRLLRTALFLWLLVPAAISQPQETPSPDSDAQSEISPSNSEVRIEAIPPDTIIQDRIRSILEATGWFENLEVQVDEGMVFLRGLTDKGFRLVCN